VGPIGKGTGSVTRNLQTFRRTPPTIYKKIGEWTDWSDFLGSDYVDPNNIEFLPWAEAREFARGLGLKSEADWSRCCESGKKPIHIPKYPADFYKKTGEWTSWGDFLGTDYTHPRDIEFAPWPRAREFARGLGLEGKADWSRYCESGKKPQDIPRNPAHYYKKTEEWTDWGDFLGTGNIRPGDIEYVPWQEAKEFARGLGLEGKADWISYCRSGKSRIAPVAYTYRTGAERSCR
jgi:hypothetical protein